jgi:hypothetical protein
VKEERAVASVLRDTPARAYHCNEAGLSKGDTTVRYRNPIRPRHEVIQTGWASILKYQRNSFVSGQACLCIEHSVERRIIKRGYNHATVLTVGSARGRNRPTE